MGGSKSHAPRRASHKRSVAAEKPQLASFGSNATNARLLGATAPSREEPSVLGLATGDDSDTSTMRASVADRGRAELYCFTVDLQPTRVPVGGDVDVRFAVGNAGPANVQETSFSISQYLQGDTVGLGSLGGLFGNGPEGSEQTWELESGEIRDLAAGESRTVVQRVTVPDDVPPGSRTRVQVVVDPEDAIREQFEFNNASLTFGSDLEVVAPGEAEGAGELPDLVVSDVGLDARNRIWVEVQNDGPGAIPAGQFSRLDLEVEVGGWTERIDVSRVGALESLAESGGGAGLITELTLDRPSEVRVAVDPGEGVFEAREDNNELVRQLEPEIRDTRAPAGAMVTSQTMRSHPGTQRDQGDASAGVDSDSGSLLATGTRVPSGPDFPARITSVDSPVLPGESVVIRGTGFGDRPGTVVAAVPGASVSCDVLQWVDDRVQVTLPFSFGSAVPDEGTDAIAWLRPARVESGEGAYPYSGEEGPRHPFRLKRATAISAGISLAESMI